MFGKIYNPKSKKMVTLKTIKGKQILLNYLNYSNYMKGGSNTKSVDNSDVIKYPNLIELHQFINMLENTEEDDLEEMYDDMICKCSQDPSEIIEKYLADTKKSYFNGKYYLGGQILLTPNEVITPEKIQEVKDINQRNFGSITNSAEAASMYRSQTQIEIMETLIEHYVIIMTHIMFRPGGIGMKQAESDFNELTSKN